MLKTQRSVFLAVNQHDTTLRFLTTDFLINHLKKVTVKTIKPFFALVHCFYLYNRLSPRQAMLLERKAKMPWCCCSQPYSTVSFGASSQQPVTTW